MCYCEICEMIQTPNLIKKWERERKKYIFCQKIKFFFKLFPLVWIFSWKYIFYLKLVKKKKNQLEKSVFSPYTIIVECLSISLHFL